MANTYLTRTFGSAGNRQSWTWSAWIKKTKVFNNTSSSDRMVWFGGYSASNDTDWLEFGTQGDVFYFTTNATSNTGNRQMRDPSAWFHAHVTYDGSNLKFYHNNVLDFNNTQLSGNRGINQASVHTIGCMPKNAGTLRFMDGIMSHVHFVDGSVLAPSVFGQTDATTGEWEINTNPSYTPGTNGFFVLKDTNSGTDQSANTNNFTVGGGTLTKTEDSPSNVFAVMNPLAFQGAGSIVLSNGATTSTNSSSTHRSMFSTLAMSSGKFYFEGKSVSTGAAYPTFGIYDSDAHVPAASYFTTNVNGYGYNSNGVIFHNNGSLVSGLSTWTDGDIIGVALDATNDKIYFSKNGVWQNSGDPSNNTGGTTITSGKTWYFAAHSKDGGTDPVQNYNFGNGYFGTTAVSSAGTNASGIGIFEYDVPTGFTALSTKGLNL